MGSQGRLVQVNCLMLLFTAHDTVASTLALMLRFLKQNPEALQKLRAEQRQVISLRPTPTMCTAAIEPRLHAIVVPKSCACILWCVPLP